VYLFSSPFISVAAPSFLLACCSSVIFWFWGECIIDAIDQLQSNRIRNGGFVDVKALRFSEDKTKDEFRLAKSTNAQRPRLQIRVCMKGFNQLSLTHYLFKALEKACENNSSRLNAFV
jgi:hypothetical protein